MSPTGTPVPAAPSVLPTHSLKVLPHKAVTTHPIAPPPTTGLARFDKKLHAFIQSAPRLLNSAGVLPDVLLQAEAWVSASLDVPPEMKSWTAGYIMWCVLEAGCCVTCAALAAEGFSATVPLVVSCEHAAQRQLESRAWRRGVFDPADMGPEHVSTTVGEEITASVGPSVDPRPPLAAVLEEAGPHLVFTAPPADPTCARTRAVMGAPGRAQQAFAQPVPSVSVFSENGLLDLEVGTVVDDFLAFLEASFGLETVRSVA